LTQCQRVTDRRTDGFTIASTALCIASYVAALQKVVIETSARSHDRPH